MAYLLHQFLTESSHRAPAKTAVICRERSLSYRELEEVTNQLARTLQSHGITRGDRVAIYLPKSLASIISIFAILKVGACYVPLDPEAPLQRLAFIIRDCGIKAILTNSEKIANLGRMFPDDSPVSAIFLVDSDSQQGIFRAPPLSTELGVINWSEVIGQPVEMLPENLAIETDTAFILYTSGSTGTPKGVMISHRNSLSFVNWAADCVGLKADDRVSSHAPLHFDLSTFDIFSSCRAGATIVIIPENVAKFPVELVKLIEQERISVCYCVPSLLTLIVLYGNLTAHDMSCLRTIIFAGEVFPIKYLKELMSLLPWARYLNWYGPTETNVCTFYEVQPNDATRTLPVPIGKACANTEVFAVSRDGTKVTKPGESGELYARGPTLMQGYWNQPEKTAKILVQNPFQQNYNEVVCKTGDIVTMDSVGNYLYQGREDGMIKTRGYRVELGEIETVLYQHSAVKEVAVLAVPDELAGNRLRAVISLHEGASLTREEVLRFCNQKLPHYMIPDSIEFRKVLPRTSTGKTDRVALAQNISS